MIQYVHHHMFDEGFQEILHDELKINEGWRKQIKVGKDYVLLCLERAVPEHDIPVCPTLRELGRHYYGIMCWWVRAQTFLFLILSLTQFCYSSARDV